jgi:hypothetical protein
MSKDRFDQSARLLARMDGEGVLNWLFPGFAGQLRFTNWLDTRSVSGPEATAQTADTVAELIGLVQAEPPWLALLEFQTEPDSRMFGRLLGQLARFWLQHRPDEERGSQYQLVAAVVNLTGTSRSIPASRRFGFPVGGFGLELRVPERYLAEESAEDTLDAIERGEVSSSLLAFIPLMQKGGEEAILTKWLHLAGPQTDAHRRSQLGMVALVLAELQPWFDLWKKALKEWNMRESTVAQEWITLGKEEGFQQGRQEGRQEGLQEGRLEQARQMATNLLRSRFGTLSPEVLARIEQTTDLNLLEKAVERIFTATSPDELFPT